MKNSKTSSSATFPCTKKVSVSNRLRLQRIKDGPRQEIRKLLRLAIPLSEFEKVFNKRSRQ